MSPSSPPSQQILGINFFDGTSAQAVAIAIKNGGLIVAPSGTCFARLQRDVAYRHALTNADLALADSGFMVLLWRLLRGKRLQRISGLAYLKALLARSELRTRETSLWVLPNAGARDKFIAWCRRHSYPVNADDCYVAPLYGSPVADEALLALIVSRRPQHIIIGLAGGVQEKLGYFLREGSSYRPAIHCIGAALVTGDQIKIPTWADRLYLGWLFRLIAQPRIFIPRLTRALALPWLIIKYGKDLPRLAANADPY